MAKGLLDALFPKKETPKPVRRLPTPIYQESRERKIIKVSENTSEKINSNSIQVTTTGVLLIAKNPSRESYRIINTGLQIAYIGDFGVLPSNGFPIYPGMSHTFEKHYGYVYAITAVGTTNLAYVEE